LQEECSGPLQDLSNKINNQQADVHSHQLLSIIKMAEVEIKIPESTGRSTPLTTTSPQVLCLLLILVRCLDWFFAHSVHGPS
jgi:hypothetical protein